MNRKSIKTEQKIHINIYSKSVKPSKCFFAVETSGKFLTGLYIDFASLTPINYKCNLVSVIFYCASQFVLHMKILTLNCVRLQPSSVATVFLNHWLIS